MPEVLEIEQTETEVSTGKIEHKWNSWTIAVPPEIIKAQGLDESALVNLTYKEGRIESQLIIPSAELKEISRRILEKNREVFEELKRLGD